MKRWLALALAAMLCLTGCHKKQTDSDNSDTTEIPAETVLSGNVPETETAEDMTDIPPLPETTEAWVNYQSKYPGSDAPHYNRLGLEDAEHQQIVGMLGSIEQRFYETKPVTKTLTEQIMAAASEFCEEEITADNLYCNLQNGRVFALSEIGAEDYSEITVLYTGIGVRYDAGTGELELWTSMHEKEIVSEKLLNGSEYSSFFTAEEMPEEQILRLADGKLSRFEVRYMASNFIRNQNAIVKDYYDHTLHAETALQQFLPAGDYQCSLLQVTEKVFADGTQGAYLEYGLYSRDMPVIYDSGLPFDNDKDREIVGMTITVGVLQSGRIDYFRSCCIHADAPDSVVLTDTRDYMEGTTLMSFEDACKIADETLDRSRSAKLIRLQYAMIALYQNEKTVGYVLTPVWHFVFPDKERMFCIDVDAVTGEAFSRWARNLTDGYNGGFYY